jgi:hypothetical protein
MVKSLRGKVASRGEVLKPCVGSNERSLGNFVNIEAGEVYDQRPNRVKVFRNVARSVQKRLALSSSPSREIEPVRHLLIF